LIALPPLTAAVTSELAVSGPVRYLAFWRVLASVKSPAGSAWERICRVAAPGPAYLYIPAFSLVRPVVQRLGVSLVEIQPELELTNGFSADAASRPALVNADTRITGEVDFGLVSPVVTSRQDARALAHFVYLAVESHEARDLRSIDYELESVEEDLLFIPAVWDPRYIHESNWRLLLREFDGLVA
jgi:hypothetical protein